MLLLLALSVPFSARQTTARNSRPSWLLCWLLAASACASTEPAVTFLAEGGDAWTFEKPTTALVNDQDCATVTFSSPAGTVIAPAVAGKAMARVPLQPGTNRLRASCAGSGRAGPASQEWEVRLANVPKAWVRIVPSEKSVVLDAGASEAAPAFPAALAEYRWQAAADNPAPLERLPARGERIELPAPPVDGEYQVTLDVTDALGRRDRSTGMFRVSGGEVQAVDLRREHPAWVDRAVVYGVVPFFFGARGLPDVTARLDEIAALGVNTIWLSPITEAPEDDFGYAVTDYFEVRARFGSPADFRALVDAAHARGMRVIMDFVPNHVAAAHPYFADVLAQGRRSPYYDYFERDAAGEASYYFDWQNLMNLNFDNPEVQRWVIEGFTYWVREFDVDGFRADVAWGPRQRAPEFWNGWHRELKRIKPDLLLLAEASARDPYYFANGFDLAYDWTDALGDWAWRRAFEQPDRTAGILRRQIAASRAQAEDDALVFRFINNNDTGARFITRYGPERTRLAAAMLLTLPGVPLVYTGDEIGAAFEPYDEGPPIIWNDAHGLRGYYQRLIALRHDHAALRSRHLQFLEIPQAAQILAYTRPGNADGGSVVVLLNWGPRPATISLSRPDREAAGWPPRLVDLMTGDGVAADEIALQGYGVRILAAGPTAASG